MSRRLTVGSLFAAFILLGIAATLLGPTLNNLTQQFGMPLENGGIFITIYSTGVTAALLLFGQVLRFGRFGAQHTMAMGLLMIATGLLILSTTTQMSVAVVATVIFGFGYGWLLIGPNVIISKLFPGDATSALNALNTFFGIGAILGPQVVNVAFTMENYRLAYIFTAAFALALIPLLLQIRVATTDSVDDQATSSPEVAVNWLVFLPFAIILFVYVGAEVGFGAWISTHLRLVAGVSEEIANNGTSLFWGGLTAGRALGTVLARYMRAVWLLMLSTFVFTVGAALIFGLPMFTWLLFVASFAVGVGAGPIFPTTIALVSDHYPKQFAAVSGLIVAAGNVGPMVIPWLQGKIGGGESGGMIVTLVCGLLMMALVTVIIRQVRNRQKEVQLLNVAA